VTTDPPPVSEPERIRALAHPVRLALLALLEEGGEATATRCAEATGESVASCSFHLRILAKYGFIEPGERRGREKPWRVVSRQRTTRPDFDDPASVRAAGALAELTLLTETERIRAFLGDLHRLPADLRDAVGMLTSAIWATPEELQQLNRDVLALVDRFAGRWENPDQRPAGARPARMFAVLYPDLDQTDRDAPR
jgi:DNA-binding transcriptional ArsR family regulator